MLAQLAVTGSVVCVAGYQGATVSICFFIQPMSCIRYFYFIYRILLLYILEYYYNVLYKLTTY